MTQEQRSAIVADLTRLNPRRGGGEIRIYVDAYADYCEAQANIETHGTVVFHPRTGAPIDNPYLRIRDRAGALLGKSSLKVGSLWTNDPDAR